MSGSSPPTIETSSLSRQALAQAILDLENGRPEAVTDPMIAYHLGHHVKPYINRLTALAEGQSDDGEEEQVSIGSLAADVEALAPDSETEDKEPSSPRPDDKRSSKGPLPQLSTLSTQEKARWIFMERFISLEKHQEILGYQFQEPDRNRFEEDLEHLLEDLLMLPDTILLAEKEDFSALQKIFASTLLIFRNPFVGDENGNPIPATIENLRHRFPAYFYKRRKTPNWYEKQSFYTEPFGQARWILCSTDYLNCTLSSPRRKLSSYSRQWHLPTENALQKSVLEDIYDRVVCGEALEEDLFEQNCHSCTSTFYRTQAKAPARLVYTAQKNKKIAIHGKPGIPHWRATKRLWPGVFPTLVLS